MSATPIKEMQVDLIHAVANSWVWKKMGGGQETVSVYRIRIPYQYQYPIDSSEQPKKEVKEAESPDSEANAQIGQNYRSWEKIEEKVKYQAGLRGLSPDEEVRNLVPEGKVEKIKPDVVYLVPCSRTQEFGERCPLPKANRSQKRGTWTVTLRNSISGSLVVDSWLAPMSRNFLIMSALLLHRNCCFEQSSNFCNSLPRKLCIDGFVCFQMSCQSCRPWWVEQNHASLTSCTLSDFISDHAKACQWLC